MSSVSSRPAQRDAQREATVTIAVVGTCVAFTYAAAAWMQIMLWNPQAAVPGVPVDEIWAAVASQQGMNEYVNTTVNLAVMPLAAVVMLYLACTKQWSSRPRATATQYLVLIALGALAYFVASFSPGMNLADTYGVGGEDYAPWGQVLLGVSGFGVAGLLVVWNSTDILPTTSPRPREALCRTDGATLRMMGVHRAA